VHHDQQELLHLHVTAIFLVTFLIVINSSSFPTARLPQSLFRGTASLTLLQYTIKHTAVWVFSAFALG
jgi:hypothetical protein